MKIARCMLLSVKKKTKTLSGTGEAGAKSDQSKTWDVPK